MTTSTLRTFWGRGWIMRCLPSTWRTLRWKPTGPSVPWSSSSLRSSSLPIDLIAMRMTPSDLLTDQHGVLTKMISPDIRLSTSWCAMIRRGLRLWRWMSIRFASWAREQSNKAKLCELGAFQPMRRTLTDSYKFSVSRKTNSLVISTQPRLRSTAWSSMKITR